VRRRIATDSGGYSALLFKDVPPAQRRAAARTAMWLDSPDVQARFSIRSFNVPVSKAGLGSAAFQDHLRANPAFKGFADLSPYGWRWPALPSYARITRTLDEGITAILREEVGARAGLARAQREAQALLDDDLRRLPA
jgi:multiple sugar transport system substrate-binding protein